MAMGGLMVLVNLRLFLIRNEMGGGRGSPWTALWENFHGPHWIGSYCGLATWFSSHRMDRIDYLVPKVIFYDW